MSQAHPRTSSVERGAFIALALFIGLVVEQVVLVPLTWVAINSLFYGNTPDPARYQEWSMIASYEAPIFVQIVTVVLIAVTVGLTITSVWAFRALRERITPLSLAFG